jgi:hypothetical protein
MKKFLLAVAICLLLFGCKSYVQVFNTKSLIKIDNEGSYVYENDSLKITYSFWQEKGIMSFTIYNKSNKPLYIDWKKSSFINNSVKLNYWIDEEKTKAISVYGTYFYDGPLLKPGYPLINTGGASISSTMKEERITFIPPESNYYRSQFYIFPITAFTMDTKSAFDEVPRKDKPKKRTKVFKATFTKENSPLVFRNFLTFSFYENFDAEFYVDNEFFIQQILEMDRKHFEQIRYNENQRSYILDENGNFKFFSEFMRPSSFYLRIPVEQSISNRKK